MSFGESLRKALHGRFGRMPPEPPLRDAIQRRDSTAVAALLEAGADPNARMNNEMTMLMFAAYMSIVTSARLLLDHGADLRATAHNGESTAWGYTTSTRDGAPEVISLFLERGIHPDETVQGDGTLLHRIVGWQHKREAVRVLINAGADVNYRSQRWGTPLHTAIMMRCMANVDLLLESGAEVNMLNHRGETSLQMALRMKSKHDLAFWEAVIQRLRDAEATE